MDRRDRALFLFVAVLVLAAAWWWFAGHDGEKGTGRAAVRLDLAVEGVRACYEAETPRLDFGTEAGKEHYVEADLRYHGASRGWYSVEGGKEGKRGALLLGGRGAFTLTVFRPVTARLVLAGCAPEEGKGKVAPVRVRLNGRMLGIAGLPRGSEPGKVSFSVPAEAWIQGENRFEIEVEGGVDFALPGFPFQVKLSAFFASAALEGVTGPRPGVLSFHAGKGGGGIVVVQPSGTCLSYFLRPRPGDRFQARLRPAGGPVEAVVRLRPAGGEAVTLFSGTVKPGEGAVGVASDLSPFAGEPCRLTLEAGRPGEEQEGVVLRWEGACIARDGSAGRSDLPEPRPVDADAPGNGIRPNVVIILLDAASTFFFHAGGAEGTAAPAVEAFAEEAVTFSRAVTPAPYTLAAVGSLMTGLLPDRHGVVWNASAEGRNFRLSKEIPTLASILSRAGYATYGVVTNPNAAALYGYGRGFDRYEELFKNPELWHEGVAPEAATARAEALLAPFAEGRTARPFFLYLHLFQPHAPYTPPERFIERFASGAYDGPADGSRAVLDGFKQKGVPDLGPSDFEHLKSLYAANLAYGDAGAGAFLDWLREKGLFERTLVVVCADHGEAFGEHRSIEHGHHLYEEALRVPLYIRWPGGRRPGRRVVETVVSLTDLLPTVAAAGGVPSPPGLDGMDLAPLAAGRRAAPPDRAFIARSDVFKPSFSIRWHGWQYIYDALTRREELYRTAEDPREKKECAAIHPVIRGYLRARLCRALCRIFQARAGEAVVLDGTFVRSVQALGYTGGGGASREGGTERRCPLARRR